MSRFWKNNRPHVPAFKHGRLLLAETLLNLQQEFADYPSGRYSRSHSGHLRHPNQVGNIPSVSHEAHCVSLAYKTKFQPFAKRF